MLGQLADLLQKSGLEMPPVAKENWANEHDVTVTVVSARDGRDAALRPIIKEIVDWEGLPTMRATRPRTSPASWALAAAPSRSSPAPSHADEVKTYLLQQLVKQPVRAKVETLLRFSSNAIWIRIYDIGAEIIGAELILIQPYFSDKALLIKITYVQS